MHFTIVIEATLALIMSAPETNPDSHSLRLRERLKAIQQNRHTGKTVTQSDTTESDDNLKLQTFSVKSCSDASIESTHISERELNYYQEQVIKLQTENALLKKGIVVKEGELKKSQEALQVMGAGGGSVTGKVVELSKKVRELQSEVYIEQSKCKKFENNQIELQQLIRLGEEELDQLREQLADKPPSLENLSPSGQKKLEMMRDEITELKARVAEGKNSNQSMKQELRLTQKALSQELGPEANKYSLSQIINSEVAWKGREQQIKLLKKKVGELRAQLQQDGICSQLDTERDLCSTSETTRLSTRQLGTVSSQSDRQRDLLKRMEYSRKETAEKAQTELEELRIQQTEFKQKCTALQARNQTLSQEVKQLKRELTDSKLRDQSNSTRQPTDTTTSCVNTCQVTIEGLKQELHKKCVQVENLTQEIANYNDHVTLPSLESATLKGTKGRQVGVSLSRAQLTDSDLLDTARVNAMLLSVSVERDKLRELVALMQERLQEAVEAGNTNETLLRQVKLSNALLEKEVGRSNKLTASMTDNLSRDTLLQRIEISDDENSALQHRLASVTQSRKEDTLVYKEMLDTSRQIFTDTLSQLKSAIFDKDPAN